jgi:hypothetical protein
MSTVPHFAGTMAISRWRRITRHQNWDFFAHVAPVAIWLLAALYLRIHLRHHWVAFDEGELGQAVDRVLAGQLPHRDFDDIWTGALAQYHALVFHLLGPSLFALREALFVAYLLWLPAVYALARRVAPPLPATATMALAAVWTVPNYPAAIPSWYILFLATWGALALAHFAESRRPRYLLAAGLAAGAAITLKVIGLYFVAATLLWLTSLERDHADAATDGLPDRVYSVLVTYALAAFVYALYRFATHVPSSTTAALLHFVLPATLIATYLVVREWRTPALLSSRRRFADLATMAAPFALGAIIPVALFLIPYVRSHAVHTLFDGVFVGPQRRFTFASAPPPSPDTALFPALGWLLVLAPVKRTRAALVAVSLALAALLAVAWHGGTVYADLWLFIQHSSWCIVLAGVLTLPSVKSPGRQYLALFLCLTALCGLVRIPYAVPAYEFYYAPFEILAVLAIAYLRPSGVGPMIPPFAAFIAIFAIGIVTPNRFTYDGFPIVKRPDVPLDIPRTGLLVPAPDAAEYEEVVRLVNLHVPPGAALYAAPDCPEIPYLTNRRNPTPTILDFLDDPATHVATALKAIADPATGGAVIYTTPHQSRRLDPVISGAIRRRFPDSVTVGAFVVRW